MNKIDLIIKKLLEKQRKKYKNTKIEEEEILSLCKKSKKIFLNQDNLLTLKTPFRICGDLHGQYYDLIKIFCFGGFPPDSKYIFLGDYVDRGKQSIETMCLLLAFKVKFPDGFFILRGNHESSVVSRIYGFYEECKKKYTSKIWKIFCSVFNCLPVAAIIDRKIFCVHGGISPLLTSLNQIKTIHRPTEIPDYGLMCDLVWADPDENISGWTENDRGVSFVFGKDVVDEFLKNSKIQLICRAHQLVNKGFQFFGNRKLVTIFSAPNYCGEFGNLGATMCINKNLLCSFHILYPF